MIILVTGGRDFTDGALVERTLSKYFSRGDKESLLIEGGARGADALCKLWAQQHGIHVATVDALWDFYLTAAGPIRNRAMTLLYPELCIAFPGGKGTADMVVHAKNLGIPVVEAK